MKTPVSDHALREYWPAFIRNLQERLLAGSRTYGDTSFVNGTTQSIEEIKQECMDIVGWGFILWTKLEKMVETVDGVQQMIPSNCPTHRKYDGSEKPKTKCERCWMIYAIKQLQGMIGLNG